MSHNRHEYLAVDLVRGLAALAVLLHHYQEFYFLSPGGPPTFAHRSDQPFYSLLAPIYVYSGWAVQLFWAISGFVFAAAYVEKRKTTREFIVGRFARLYPLHFITLVVIAGIQIASMHSFGAYQIYPYNDGYHFALNLFFASWWGFQKGFSFNAPIWSVSVEVAIYAVFWITVPLIVRLRAAGAALLVVAFYAALEHSTHSPFWHARYDIFQCGYYFYLGILLYWVLKSSSGLCLVIGASLLVVWRFAGYDNPDQLAPQSVPSLFAGIILLAALIDKVRLARGSFRRLSWIGECTYSVYLWYTAVIMLATCVLTATGANRSVILNQPWFFVMFIVLVFGVGRLSFHYIERPAQRYIIRRWVTRGAPDDAKETTQQIA